MQFIKRSEISSKFSNSVFYQSLAKKLVAIAAVGFALCFQPLATADESKDVMKLIKGKQFSQALSQADAYLEGNPRDAQMRFLKGIILTETDKTAEAIEIFSKLTRDFPELPEPYNNLAVLHAAQGDYDKARGALEAAIRTHPSYATAYENLGDIYAKLASQSYDRALQIDGRNAAAQTKLSMVQSIVVNAFPGSTPTSRATPSSRSASPTVALSAPSPTTPVAPTSTAFRAPPPPSAPPPRQARVQQQPSTQMATRRTAPTRTAPQRPTPARRPESITLPPISSSSAANATDSLAARSPVPAITQPQPRGPATSSIGADRRALASVERWAAAWSNQDMGSYLDSYSREFTPPRGMSRSSWEAQRRRRIVGKENIRVVVENPLITLTGDSAVIKFKQKYYSDKLTNISNKTLTLKLEGTKWRIVKEQVDG